MTLLQHKLHRSTTVNNNERMLYDQRAQSQHISALFLCRQVPVIGMLETCREVMDIFKSNPELPCIVYCREADRPEGLIMRDDMFRRMTGRFSREIYDHRPATYIADMQPMMADISLPLSKLLHQALNRQESKFYDCVLMTDQNKLLGVLTVQDLLHLSTSLQKEAESKREFILNESISHTLKIEQSLNQVASAAQVTQARSLVIKEWSQSGNEKLEHVSSSYKRLVSSIEQRVDSVSQLLQNANHISSMTKQIASLADHSNLLAINASIEAAHAGEHGKGFRIVAGEVQSFAKQIRNLSEDISNLLIQIHRLVTETAEATASSLQDIRSCESAVAEGGHIFVQLEQVAKEVGDSGGQVHDLTEEASALIKQIKGEMEMIDLQDS